MGTVNLRLTHAVAAGAGRPTVTCRGDSRTATARAGPRTRRDRPRGCRPPKRPAASGPSVSTTSSSWPRAPARQIVRHWIEVMVSTVRASSPRSRSAAISSSVRASMPSRGVQPGGPAQRGQAGGLLDELAPQGRERALTPAVGIRAVSSHDRDVGEHLERGPRPRLPRVLQVAARHLGADEPVHAVAVLHLGDVVGEPVAADEVLDVGAVLAGRAFQARSAAQAIHAACSHASKASRVSWGTGSV